MEDAKVWAKTPKGLYFGMPSWGNDLLQIDSVHINQISKAMILKKIQKDIPNSKVRLRNISLNGKKNKIEVIIE